MTKALQLKLFKKYPKIFKKDSHYQTPLSQRGIECLDGWFDIIDILCSKIQWHLDNPRWVEDKSFLSKLKKLWNLTVWNHIIYPIVVSKPFTKNRCWKLYNFCNKYFHFHIIFRPPKNLPQQTRAVQIKEKFGLYRAYFDNTDDYIDGLISFAESISSKICENCGSTDNVTTSGSWLKTLCNQCRKKTQLKRF